jgi:hypothetical protein
MRYQVRLKTDIKAENRLIPAGTICEVDTDALATPETVGLCHLRYRDLLFCAGYSDFEHLEKDDPNVVHYETLQAIEQRLRDAVEALGRVGPSHTYEQFTALESISRDLERLRQDFFAWHFTPV